MIGPPQGGSFLQRVEQDMTADTKKAEELPSAF
jgi:hypothetical protein